MRVISFGDGRPIGTRGDVTKLPASPENDVIRYGHSLIVDTAKHIGKAASDPQKRYAGNDLACVNCHLGAGLRPFAAPFVSTFATFPCWWTIR